MTKILHVFKLYYPEIHGGVQRVIYDLANGANDHGFKSLVFALSKKPNPTPFNVEQHRAITINQQFYAASTGFSLSAFAPFRKYAAKADIVHYHFPWPFMDLLHLSSQLKKPTILTYHSDIVKQSNLVHLYKPLMHKFLGEIDRIVSTSPNYFDSSLTLNRYSNKTSIIPLGIPDEEVTPKQEIVKKWKSQLGDGFFLFLGALRYYKGLSVLMDAARRTGLPVVIAGSGDYQETLKKQAPNNVIFTGHYTDDDRDALLSLARVFVFPSNQRSEAFGVSLLEAARASVPMITCEIGTGTSYVNQQEVTGLVVPRNDPDALALAMRRLASEPAVCAQFGLAARKRFEEKFTANHMVKSYAKEYSKLLNNK